LKIATNWQ